MDTLKVGSIVSRKVAGRVYEVEVTHSGYCVRKPGRKTGAHMKYMEWGVTNAQAAAEEAVRLDFV